MRRVGWSLVLAGVVGCQPLWEVRGTIKSTTPARVSLACPSKGPSAHGTVAADPTGAFRMHDTGFMSPRCRIEVSAAGYRTIDLELRPYCRRWVDDNFCRLAEIEVKLEPGP